MNKLSSLHLKHHKKMCVKVLYLNAKTHQRLIKCPNGHHFNETGIDDQLMKIATFLEQSYPASEFKMVPLSSRNSLFKCPTFVFVEELKHVEEPSTLEELSQLVMDKDDDKR